ncbi:MAG TPA: S1/P1 nuclease, partial [Armatimonadota bacterium]|nr:S1/P1 nuclease [Armatimonadota bacterium]
MRFHIALVLSLSAAVLSPRPGHAWNPPGHMLSGALAYKELSTASPATRAKVSELLRAHPHFQTEWQPLMARLNIPPEQQDAFLFMQAARWPDDIRNTPFHRGSWHYINHRFTPLGRPRLIPVRASEDEQRGNIEGAFIRNQRILLDASKPADERAVALCWLFHLIGDVHQPLHTVALFAPRFPQGDRGGNEFFIRTEEGARTLGLHALWDGILLGDQRFFAVN